MKQEIKPVEVKKSDYFLSLYELEVQAYDEILSLDISDEQKDSICGKLNELLNKLYERVEK